MTRKIRENVETSVDYQTGEVKTERSRYTIDVEKNQEFAMFFGEKIAGYYRLNNQQKNVLAALSLNMEYGSNVVFVTSPRRKEWAEAIGISLQAFNNAMKRLMDSRIVVKQGNGQYMIDPHLYSKANFSDRLKSKEVFLTKLVFEVDTRNGCKVTNAGVETEVLKPLGVKIDHETGELLYKYKKGGEFGPKRHDDNIDSSQDTKIDNDSLPY